MTIDLLEQLIISFFIYSVIGWCCEMLYCGVLSKHLTNRGFLHGPYLPIYGFGALVIVYMINHLTAYIGGSVQTGYIAMFFAGMISSSILEYFGSWGLEKIFHIKLWDYSSHKFNINGRVCLLNSTLFGLLGLFVMIFLRDQANHVIEKIPSDTLYYLSTLIVLVMSIDFTVSFISMKAFQRSMENLRLKNTEFKEKLAALSQMEPSEASAEIRAKINERFEPEIIRIKGEIGKKSKRIIASYPSMTSRNEKARLQLELAKLEFRSWREKGIEQANKRKEQLNLMMEDAKAKMNK